MRVATPAGYEPDASDRGRRRKPRRARPTRKIELFRSAEEAVAGAQAVYTDVWASMGQEEEAAERAKQIFAPYQVNAALFDLAAPDAVFHALPAGASRREVTDAVIDSARSVVFDQAENRLHVQKAILLMLLSYIRLDH